MNRAQFVPAQSPKQSSPAGKPKTAAKQKTAARAAAPQARAGKRSMETLLARVETVRHAQRLEGSFDCFAKARNGFCDQGGCLYHTECLDFSQRIG